MEIENIDAWHEVTMGLYRYVVAAKACYEIQLTQWDHRDELLNASANLYVVGEWRNNSVIGFFERELLGKGNVKECLKMAANDYKTFVILD